MHVHPPNHKIRDIITTQIPFFGGLEKKNPSQSVLVINVVTRHGIQRRKEIELVTFVLQ